MYEIVKVKIIQCAYKIKKKNILTFRGFSRFIISG